ncbi:hypothetical protein Arub01_44130 [Actinomadura rubrobrunea]|uniref:DUF58 domain-containing protein n=1 Tax=Actinomadura rubrobrunea TaxID=115335 RepID=A0A9W6UWG9_9ACTN|nr:DUF58 domain-containing protein [Actinomadura rubrobrunea]GLW66169.1 hypothetical protein Arub01_44130 [Actinomadura rubrobrunea]
MNATPALRDLAPEHALRRLELTVTRRLDGLLQGDHLGLLPGPGSEPAEGRAYMPGDDVRAMDWNLTARAAAPHVRDRVADRELETWALVDATASMDFGTGRLEKRDLAVFAVAAVAFLTERTGNRVGARILRDDGTVRVPARTGRPHLLGLLRTLLATPRGVPGRGGRGSASASLGAAAELLRRTEGRRRGLVVAVSDFLDPVESWRRPLRLLAARHQLLAVEVVDPRELTLPDVGMLTVVDPETGRRREIPTASRRLRERYAAAAAEQRAAIAAGLRAAGAAHLRLRTDGDWMRDLVRHVLAHRRTAAAAPHPRAGAASPADFPGGGAP